MNVKVGRYVDPATHEVGANLIFTNAGLSPYHGLHAVTRGTDHGETVTGTFIRNGDRYVASLKPKSSGLAPRDDPSFEYETVKEFSLHVEPEDADEIPAAPSVTFTVAPRWPNLESTGDSPNPANPGNILGVNVTVNGSNIPLDEYPSLLRRGMSAVDINPSYFSDPHEYSNVWRYESYARINRECSASVIGDEGPLRRIMEYIEDEGSFRELREDDGEIAGYHHRVKFDSEAAGALVSGHDLGKQIKHYHPKHVHGDPDDALYHPKVGVAFLSKRTEGGSVRWSDREEMIREVDETLLNVLSWSGLTVREDTRTYVQDAHFMGEETERDLSLIEDPLPEIKREQDAALVKVLNGVGTGNPDLTESDTEVLRVIADGGQPQDVGALAEAIEASERTVYRVVDRLGEVLSVDNGTVSFVSEYLQSKARHGLQAAADALEKASSDREGTSPWLKFLDAYGPAVGERFPDVPAERIELDFGEVPPDADMDEILQKGFIAWLRSGRDRAHYTHGQAHWTVDGESHSTPAVGGMDVSGSVRLTGSDSESPLGEIFD